MVASIKKACSLHSPFLKDRGSLSEMGMLRQPYSFIADECFSDMIRGTLWDIKTAHVRNGNTTLKIDSAMSYFLTQH